jgi:release factor glutamine methyltransferase
MQSKESVLYFQKEIIKRIEPLYGTAQAQQYSWWILEFASDFSRAQLLSGDVQISKATWKQIESILDQLIIDQKPLAYIFKEVPFAGFSLAIRPPILIPRHETEEWVIRLCTWLKKYKNKSLTILDLCTGSGCIAITMAKFLPHAKIDAVDINPDALALAQENAERNTASNIRFIHSDLFSTLNKAEKYDLIISNPPYASEAEWKNLDQSVVKWEAKNAIVASENGLAVLSEIVRVAPLFLKQNSVLAQDAQCQLIVEIGETQGTAVQNLMHAHGFEVTVYQDGNGKDRVVTGYRK